MPAVRPSLQPLTEVNTTRFQPPDMGRPLDLVTELAEIPTDATISGMFPMAVAQEAAKRGSALPSARPRYVAFNFYPLYEHVQLLFEGAPLLFPGVPLRKALRKLGRGAAYALLQSTVGRVILAEAVTPLNAIEAIAKAYCVNLKPGEARLTSKGARHAIVELKDVHYLLDTNHVGAMEGVLRPLEIRPEVRIHRLGPGHAEFLITW